MSSSLKSSIYSTGSKYLFSFSCTGLDYDSNDLSIVQAYLYRGGKSLYLLDTYVFPSSHFSERKNVTAFLSPYLMNGTDYYVRVVDYFNSSLFGDSPHFTIKKGTQYSFSLKMICVKLLKDS